MLRAETSVNAGCRYGKEGLVDLNTMGQCGRRSWPGKDTTFSLLYGKCSLVVHGGCRAGQVVDLVHFQHDGLHHIVTDELKVGLANQMLHILPAASKEAVQADHLHNHRTVSWIFPACLVAKARARPSRSSDLSIW